jgi:Fe-S oxidoreductase
VSNAEPVETLTPWGKMSVAYFVGRGDVPLEPAFAEPAWACTGCYACRERCDHKNEVARTLLDTRAELLSRGVAPDAALRVRDEQPEREREMARAARELSLGKKGPARLLLGCGYARHAPDEAKTAVRVAERLLGCDVAVSERCCGLPLLEAGDRPGFLRAARAFASDVAGAHPLVVLDPGCAHTLLVEYPRLGVPVVEPRLLVDLAAAATDRMARDESVKEPPRYHDPCRLGRGLGRYDGPREILAKVAGAPPREFQRQRELADCSGGGGIVPATRPTASAAMADARLAQHAERGGGTLVTACASSLRRFRSRGAPVEDLVTWMARGLGIDVAPGRRDGG